MSLLDISDKVETAEIALTEAAAAKIKVLSETLAEAKGKYLRVFVQGGGCSGFTYNFKFDDKSEKDTLLEKNGATCLLDPQSASLLRGSSIDYKDGLTGAGFVVNNPNATATCGCGSSFST